MICFMQMCVLQNNQTYGGVGNSVCYEWQEPHDAARVKGESARAEGERKRGGVWGGGSMSPLPRKILKVQT